VSNSLFLIKVFEENDNFYPDKPVYLDRNEGRNRVLLILFILLIVFASSSYELSAYIILAEALGVLLIHELGHFVMQRILKQNVQGMFLISFIGNYTKSLKNNQSLKAFTSITLMGPMPGIVIGLVLFFIALNAPPNQQLVEISFLFISINVLNLLPIDPFDGGKILNIFFFNQNDNYKMIFVLVSSIILIIVGFLFSYLPIVIFGLLMAIKVRSLQKSYEMHLVLDEQEIDYKKDYNSLSNGEYWKIRKVFLDKNPKLKEMIPDGFTVWENENLLMDRIKQILRIPVVQDLSFTGKLIVVGIILTAIVLPIYVILSNGVLLEWYFNSVNV
jgi:stage IV sporulation protein FB